MFHNMSAHLYFFITGNKMPVSISLSLGKKCPSLFLYHWEQNARLYFFITGNKMTVSISLSWEQNARLYFFVTGNKMPVSISLSLGTKCPSLFLYHWEQIHYVLLGEGLLLLPINMNLFYTYSFTWVRRKKVGKEFCSRTHQT